MIIFIFILVLLSQGRDYPANELSYGVTFVKSHSEWLGLPWRDNFSAILEDLRVKRLRLPAFWDEIQASSSERSDYADLDWQIDKAGENGAAIILAVGYRLPRWPECHIPDWAQKLEQEEREKKVLDYIRTTIERYKDKDQIIAWQVENEPFLTVFGECPKFNPKFLDQEIALVKKIDSRPIIVTDSGELSLWVPAAKRADIFGTSLYLNTYSEKLKRYVHYPITPSFFHFKKNVASLFAHPKNWIVIELQAEPWGPIAYKDMGEAEKSITMDPGKFRRIIEFSRQAGFKEFYLWGAEWWYWEKTIKNNPVYWEEARKLFGH